LNFWTLVSKRLLEILKRQAEPGQRLFEIIGEHRRADQVGSGALVVSARGFRAQLAPVLGHAARGTLREIKS
jgi:hypothetical protein